MIKRIICLVLLVLFLIIGAAFAQGSELKGKKELSLQGMLTATEDTKTINTNIAIGYFVSNDFEIGPVFGGGFTYNDMNSYNGNVGFFLKWYYTSQSKTVPYITGTGGVYFQKTSMPDIDLGGLGLEKDFSSTNTMVSFGFGIKRFISENTSFFFQWELMEVFAEESTQQISNATFGFSALF